MNSFHLNFSLKHASFFYSCTSLQLFLLFNRSKSVAKVSVIVQRSKTDLICSEPDRWESTTSGAPRNLGLALLGGRGGRGAFEAADAGALADPLAGADAGALRGRGEVPAKLHLTRS